MRLRSLSKRAAKCGVLIVLLAELNFRYVEEPLRRVGSERAKRQLMQLEGDKN